MSRRITVEDNFQYKYKNCVIVKREVLGVQGYTTYVFVIAGSPLYGLEEFDGEGIFDDSVNFVHGGITSACKPSDVGLPVSDQWCFGIDFLHNGDKIEYGNLERVKEECFKLVDYIQEKEEVYLNQLAAKEDDK